MSDTRDAKTILSYFLNLLGVAAGDHEDHSARIFHTWRRQTGHETKRFEVPALRLLCATLAAEGAEAAGLASVVRDLVRRTVGRAGAGMQRAAVWTLKNAIAGSSGQVWEQLRQGTEELEWSTGCVAFKNPRGFNFPPPPPRVYSFIRVYSRLSISFRSKTGYIPGFINADKRG